MFKIHMSLRDDYKVITDEQHHLVKTARGCEGEFPPRNTLDTKKTLKERLREHKCDFNRAVRELDRECANLHLQEKKHIIENMKMTK
ncbi:Charged multivesicular body protein 2a [Phytophthora cinnamomi]|uniref:Charged multivesicular body protein 2a n=1 Tax=Phytophthora cinnamomi TaxID=4785 RepID=UPI00355A08C9|nr:Charged multivesicular body protein 2a [Phytophthora cinnamomi]